MVGKRGGGAARTGLVSEVIRGCEEGGEGGLGSGEGEREGMTYLRRGLEVLVLGPPIIQVALGLEVEKDV